MLWWEVAQNDGGVRMVPRIVASHLTPANAPGTPEMNHSSSKLRTK